MSFGYSFGCIKSLEVCPLKKISLKKFFLQYFLDVICFKEE